MEQSQKSGNVEKDSDTKEQAFTHLAQGKRHLLVKDYNEATTSLSMACDLLSKLYGELANECGEAYFNYGKALLELARTENGVLGIEGERDESQESDDGDGEDEGDEEKLDSTTGSESKKVENGKNEEKEAEADSKNAGETNDGDANENKENSTENNEEEEDDVDNLHLAWQMLEMAKVVFQRQAEENKQMNLKLAEVHLKLGEVSLESENYSQGIEEIKTCLDIQLKNLDKHDRHIAETHYQLGVAYTLNNEFDQAIEHYTKALNLLKARIEYLQEREKQGVTNEQENESNPFYSIKEEIAEISALLPEVKEKISDVEDYKKDTVKALIACVAAKKENNENSAPGQGTSTSSSSATAAFPLSSESTTKPVSDISHLVRKKL